jgi:hypothetical protein
MEIACPGVEAQEDNLLGVKAPTVNISTIHSENLSISTAFQFRKTNLIF